MCARLAGSSSPSTFFRTFLGSFAVIGAASDQTRGARDATTQTVQLGHDFGKESNALADPNFGGIVSQVALFLDHAPIDVKGTTDTPGTSQAQHFGAQECVGTFVLPICSSLDGDWHARTPPGTAMWSIVISLPQFVLGHVPFQQLASHEPLSTGTANGIKAPLRTCLVGRFHHGNMPTSVGWIRLGCIKEKDAGKG